MTVSKLAQGSIIAWNKCNSRSYQVTRITPHQMAAHWTGAQCASYFQTSNVQSSANYCIGYNGDIVCNVPEEYRAWTSSSWDNDQRAITVELSNSGAGAPYMTDATIEAFIKLCVDLIKRYPGLGGRMNYNGRLSGNVSLHEWFAATSCPGSYFKSKLPYIQSEVNRRLKEGDYMGIIQVAPNMSDSQLWKFEEDGEWLIVRNKSGKVLDVKGGTGEKMANGRVVQAYKDNGTDAQRWHKVEGVGGGFRLVSKLDEGYCLDVKNGAVNARKNILLHTLQEKPESQWAQSFVAIPYYGSGDWYTLINCKSGWAIDSNPSGYDYQ